MACSRPRKRSKKDVEKALQESIDECNRLLESSKKPRKKTRFRISRDPVTGRRKTHCGYQPRFTDQPGTSSCQDSDNSDLDEVSVCNLAEMQQSAPSTDDDDLEAALMRCNNVLSTYTDPATKKWDTRMSNLTMKWDSSRKRLLEAILSCEGLPSPNICPHCCEEKVLIRCSDCPKRFYCPSCDRKVHSSLPFHGREGFVNGFFEAIPPTITIGESGLKKDVVKAFPYFSVPHVCPNCKEAGVLSQVPTTGTIIVVNEKGRFDLNKCAVQCSSCHHAETLTWTLHDVVVAGYWPGSPTDTSYVFDQQLFFLWDFMQKRMPGTSESSFVKALEDFSLMRGRAPTINHATFSRSFKEWKFCQFELEGLQGLDWMKCPTCSISQHSCHVDGNMKLYRYKSSGSQRRPSYYGNIFIANKCNVDNHLKAVYSKTSRSKESDNRCGDTHWRAANNGGRKSAKLDETGLEIAGCRHGLAQWAVNMFQGELYGYANYIHLKKMIPAGVKYFWEDIVCKYWKWARKAGGLEGSDMKPALSIMHGKAHNWTCQVIWGGRWQDGSAASTGEEVEQINSHMSRCGNTTKYMLPENREELITEHALKWNRRKILGMVQSLPQRYLRAIEMQDVSRRELDDALASYHVPLSEFHADEWKKEVTSHAQEAEILQGTAGICLQDEIEMLVSNIELISQSMNKLPDSSKQRTRLRSKITAEKAKLTCRVQTYNEEIQCASDEHPSTSTRSTLSEIMKGNFPWGNNEDTPIRIKRMVVEKQEIVKRWEEEVSLLKKEMVNFISCYMDVEIPRLKKVAEGMQAKIDGFPDRCDHEPPADAIPTEASVEANGMMGRYQTEAEDIAVISGKLACAKKGIAFCQGQLTSAASKFKVALVGSSCEESRKIIDIEGDSVDDANENGSDDDSENEDSPVVPNNVPDDMAETDKIDVVGENISQSNMVLWKFPTEVSQSTLDGRNGSSACSVIALIFAHVAKRELLDLQPTPLLSPVWVMLLCSAIRLGNKLYDLCRHSLPQRFLSASEAATIVERCVSVSVDAPLPVRVYDDHAPTTLLFQLRTLCSGDRGDAAVLIANEKTVLFMSVGNSSIVLVDTHRHGSHGAVVLLGHVDSLNQFVHVCQNVLELQDDTYANLSFISF